MSRESRSREGKVLMVGLGCVAWAKPGKTVSEEGIYELFPTRHFAVSHMGKVRVELLSRECRKLCCLRNQEQSREPQKIPYGWSIIFVGWCDRRICRVLNFKESGFNSKASSPCFGRHSCHLEN